MFCNKCKSNYHFSGMGTEWKFVLYLISFNYKNKIIIEFSKRKFEIDNKFARIYLPCTLMDNFKLKDIDKFINRVNLLK